MATDGAQWIQAARRTLQVADFNFFKVRPARYWFDFLFSMLLAYGFGAIYLTAPFGFWPRVIAFPLAVFWIYRLVSLVHEVCHLGQGEMRAYKIAWNLCVGVMTLSPSPFFTRQHRDHHSQKLYGRPEDPEYIVNSLRRGEIGSILGFALLVAVYPLLVFCRFFFAPWSFLHPRLREWVLQQASSMTFTPRYVRKLNDFDRRAVAAIELLCWLRATAMIAFVVLGWSDWTRLPLLYAIALGVITLNQLRLLADHHFESHGEGLELNQHIQDSCNYTGRDFMTWLLFPFAIRYHALHHLFPSLPYHNLQAAHEYLTARLPADSPYHSLDQPSWWHVARQTLFPHAASTIEPTALRPSL